MNLKRIIIILLLFVLVGNFAYRTYTYRSNYLIKYDHVYWTNKYLKSQWVVPNSKEGIGDDGLYAYAGYDDLKGKNPVLIAPEVPPLGKYLIGLSILVFHNQAIFAILTGISTLIIFYFLCLFILKSPLFALLTVTAFSFEPLFFTQLSAPYLDLLYLTFILAFLYSLLKQNFLLTALFLGLMAGTKSTLTSFALGIPVSLFYLFLTDKKLIKQFLLFLPISLMTLLLIYGRYFFLGNSLRDFLGLQKYVYLFYTQGAKGVFASFLSILFMGKWPTWWGTTENVKEWSLIWPFITIISTLWLLYLIIIKKLNNLLLPSIWLGAYGVFLLFIPVWPRYLLLLLPFLYLIFIHLVQHQFLKRLKN